MSFVVFVSDDICEIVCGAVGSFPEPLTANTITAAAMATTSTAATQVIMIFLFFFAASLSSSLVSI
ncbi:MAG: hypothetical protein DBY14_01705 [Escherichia coli]|nr:MAG: hypothetical protein DBY14_01705 [Escherichia coli]